MASFLIEIDHSSVRVVESVIWLSGRGWVLADDPVERITVYLGANRLCPATIGAPSPHVARAHPAHPHSARAGFFYAARVPNENIDLLELRIQVDAGGAQAQRAFPMPSSDILEHDLSDETAAADVGEKPENRRQRPAPLLLKLDRAGVDTQSKLRVEGWAVSLSPIDKIEIFLGQRRLGLAERGQPREDVSYAYPEYPDAGSSGFRFVDELPLMEESPNSVLLRVVARARGGVVRTVEGPLAFAQQARRERIAEALVHVYCDTIILTDAGALEVEGWAICPSGLTEIEIDLDEETLGRAQTGLDRPDVGNRFPGVPGNRTAGFRFVAALNRLVEGERVVGLTVRGRGGEERVVLQPVQVSPSRQHPRSDYQVADEPPIRLQIDTPMVQDGVALQPHRGFLSVAGWATAAAGIAHVEIEADGTVVGLAYYGIRREDIRDAFPNQPEALRSGFAMVVPPHLVPPGIHEIKVVARDRSGDATQAAFSVRIEPAIEQKGPWQLRHKVPFVESRMNRAIAAAAAAEPEITLVIRSVARAANAVALARTLLSLERQVWPTWRVVILTQPETADAVRQSVEGRFPLLSDRLTVAGQDTAAALESIVPDTGSPYLAMICAGDELGADAAMELATAALRHPGADLIYSDERRRDPSDGVIKAFFKPDWSPDLQAQTNYIGRIWAAKRDLVARCGVSLAQLAHAGEYDLTLRMSEQASEIRHIPLVLCERGARNLDDRARERRALRRAGVRRARPGKIVDGCVPGTWRTVRPAGRGPLVSIIIPTVAARDLIKLTIASIRDKTGYRNFEIICLDNVPATNPAAKSWLRAHADAVVNMEARFNWSLFNNTAVAHAKGDLLLFLNDDVEVIDPDWLEVMVEIAGRPDIGVVGPQLLYPDRKVQHAGMFIGSGHVRHAFRFAPSDEPGPFGLARTQREVASVTGACMMVRRDVFERLGRFDEDHSVVNNDVDFCLRATKAGYRVIYTPYARLIHHEMASREHIADVFHKAKFTSDWGLLFAEGDRYFHPSLLGTSDDYVPDLEPVEVLHVGHPIYDRDSIRHILVVKADHIGDFVTAMPAIRLLRKHFPHAKLSILCARGSMPVARTLPEIEEAIEFNLFHARSDKGMRKVARREWQELRARLGAARYDIAIDLRLQPDTRVLLDFSGARLLAGFDPQGTMEHLDIALPWEGDRPRTRKRSHVSDRLCELVEAVALAGSPDRAGLSPNQFPAANPVVLEEMSALRRRDSAVPDRRLVCVHPGVGNSARQWPERHFAALIDMFTQASDAAVILIGGPDEAVVASRVLVGVRHSARVLSLVGRTRLADLPGILARCDLYVGNNSGPQHLAASLGVPTLGIHSGVVDAAEWGPFGARGAAIRRRTICSPCYLSSRAECPRHMTCIDDLAPGAVHAAGLRLLA